MVSTVERFSNRVSNYVKYRPEYPGEVLDLFIERMGLTPRSVVADIGAGTGLSSKLFVENGNPVIAVEPNEKMREAARSTFARRKNFTAVDGISGATTLPDASADLVIAAQAFHWFPLEGSRVEFRRILRPKGWIALLWNERQVNSTPFLTEYEAFLKRYAADYEKVRHERIGAEQFAAFFQQPYETAEFTNSQIFDLEGLLGRVASTSYMPSEDDDAFPAMADELKLIFAKHQQSGKIAVFYDTKVYYTQY